MESHTRHLSRYSVMPKGLYTPEGRKDRKVVAIDIRPTPTTKAADEFIQITPGSDFEIIHVLRCLINDIRLPGLSETDLVGGVPFSTWQELAKTMKECRYGVVMYGIGLTQSRGRDLNTEEIISLADEMNKYTRFYAIAMRGHGNVNGANQALVWQTGYPMAINFQRGYPRFNPGEFSAMDVFSRKETDAVLIIATDPGAHFPAPALRHLQSIPTIVIDPHRNCCTDWATVVIPVAPVGVGVEGTFYRMDNVPLRLPKLIDVPLPSDFEVLKAIKDQVSSAGNKGESD